MLRLEKSYTYQRLISIREAHPQRNAPGLEGYEAAAQYYAEIFADPDVNALDNQLVFGWGRLTPQAQQLAKRISSACFGSIHDPNQVQLLLTAQGIDLKDVTIAELGGLCWG